MQIGESRVGGAGSILLSRHVKGNEREIAVGTGEDHGVSSETASVVDHAQGDPAVGIEHIAQAVLVDVAIDDEAETIFTGAAETTGGRGVIHINTAVDGVWIVQVGVVGELIIVLVLQGDRVGVVFSRELVVASRGVRAAFEAVTISIAVDVLGFSLARSIENVLAENAVVGVFVQTGCIVGFGRIDVVVAGRGLHASRALRSVDTDSREDGCGVVIAGVFFHTSLQFITDVVEVGVQLTDARTIVTVGWVVEMELA